MVRGEEEAIEDKPEEEGEEEQIVPGGHLAEIREY